MAVSDTKKRARDAERRGGARVRRSAALPAIGLEAEFATVIDGVQQRPEDVFGSPRAIVQAPMLHRTGRSYHLPTSGAVYFDTGVIEIATPMIEIERGCGARGARSLWESLALLRSELDGWEQRDGRQVRLVGFSTHYNVSFDPPAGASEDGRTVEQLAYLLTHLIAAPVMLLAANRRSTGIGVRPRGNRVEITADFTPDAGLMAATATLIVGIVREVMRWPSYNLAELERRGIPTFRGFVPEPHGSRKGWVAKDRCFAANPFACDPDETLWRTGSGEAMSLREIAGRTTRQFWDSIRALGDPLSLQLIGAVMHGRAPSLLELADRPAAYEDVGRLCRWNDLFPVTLLPRSRYERVLSHAIAGRRVRMEGSWHRPVGVRGWTHIVLRRESDGARRVRSLDELLAHLDAWDRTADRRRVQRRRHRSTPVGEAERRALEERRLELQDSGERRRASDDGMHIELLDVAAPSAAATSPVREKMLDSIIHRDANGDTPKYVAPELSYLLDRIVNVCFIGGPGAEDRGWTLVDCGLPGSASKIKRAAARLFGEGSRPAAIVLTHGHFDHIGAVHTLAHEWDVPVYAHPLELPYLTGQSAYPPPDPLVGGGAMSVMSALFPKKPIDLGRHAHELPADGSVPGAPGWRWIPTPGHSPGHVSLLRDSDRTVIAGDAFTTTKQESLVAALTQRSELHGPPMYFTPDWDAARASLKHLADYAPTTAITGHGPPLRAERLQEGLRSLSSHFDVRARPSRGRYRDHPAVTDASGVVDVPPPQISARTVALAGLALGSAIAIGIALSRREDGNRLLPVPADLAPSESDRSAESAPASQGDGARPDDVSLRARELGDTTSQIDASSSW